MTQTDWEFNLGGAMGIGGFRPSLSPSFGSNIIARNEAYRITGPSGFLNTFYGTFNVFDNYGEDVYASQADGNALLFDHGTNDTVAYGNHFRRVIGNEATENSGCAIMILNTTNITVYGNVFEGCKIGVYIGNKGAGQSSNVYNNTFTDCSLAGVLMLSTADMATNLIRNNIFTSKASVPSVWVKGGTLTSESSNCYHGFKAPQGYTAPPSTVYIDPKLDADYRPGTPELVRSALYLGGKDFNSKHFYNPPNYGAVDDVSATPRYLLMRP
jgi:hypothetical protein